MCFARNAESNILTKALCQNKPGQLQQGRIMTIATKALGVSICFSLLTGCVSMDNFNDNRTATKITNDAVRLNEAFNRSTNAVILKNVLRARDRWTVNFTTLSGITSSPSSKLSGSMGFGPLGLGNAAGPFTGSDAGIGSSRSSSNEYSINPFASHKNSQSLLSPTSIGVFKGYYDSGWPKDVVFLLFVRSLEIDLGGKPYVLQNAGDNFAELKHGLERLFDYKPGASLDLKKDFMLDIHEGKNVFVLSEAGRAKSSLSSANMNSAGLEFNLRSFEDIIYFLGEVARVPSTQSPQASSPCNGQPGPIFVIHDNQPGLVFAASVAHAGQTYSVLPQYSEHCFVERTSTSMSILNQLLLLNQSSEFLKAPNNFFR